MGGGAAIVEEKPAVTKILKIGMGMAEVDMPGRWLQAVFVPEVGEDTGSEDSFGQQTKSHPWKPAAVDSSMGEPLEGMTIGGHPEPLAERADGLIGGAGVDQIAVKEDAVVDPGDKLVPLEVGQRIGELFEGADIGRDGVVIAQYNDKAAVRVGSAQLIEEGGGCLNGTGKGTMTGPLKVKDVAIEDKEIDLIGCFANPIHVALAARMVAEEVKIGYGGAPDHKRDSNGKTGLGQ